MDGCERSEDVSGSSPDVGDALRTYLRPGIHEEVWDADQGFVLQSIVTTLYTLVGEEWDSWTKHAIPRFINACRMVELELQECFTSPTVDWVEGSRRWSA
eukprot:scaffold18656_cov82-Attheya_sp.AAC.2